MNDKDRRLKRVSKECGGGFPIISLRGEVEVNKIGSWGGRCFRFTSSLGNGQHFRVRA